MGNKMIARCGYCSRPGDSEKMTRIADGAFCNDWCADRQFLNPTPLYREHNEIEIPGFLHNWSDVSYHNDLCARSECPSIGTQHTADHLGGARRPLPDRESPESPKFVVQFCLDGGKLTGEEDFLYEGDDAVVAA